MEMLNSIFEIKARLGWAGLVRTGQTARCVQVSISSTGNMGYSDSGLFSLTPGQGDTAAAEDEDGVMMMVTTHLHHHLQFLCPWHSNTQLTVCARR